MFEFLFIVIGSIIFIVNSIILDVVLRVRDEDKKNETPKLCVVESSEKLYANETYGRPWEPMSYEQFCDWWMTLNDEDKFYVSTECWRFDMEIAA